MKIVNLQWGHEICWQIDLDPDLQFLNVDSWIQIQMRIIWMQICSLQHYIVKKFVHPEFTTFLTRGIHEYVSAV